MRLVQKEHRTGSVVTFLRLNHHWTFLATLRKWLYITLLSLPHINADKGAGGKCILAEGVKELEKSACWQKEWKSWGESACWQKEWKSWGESACWQKEWKSWRKVLAGRRSERAGKVLACRRSESAGGKFLLAEGVKELEESACWQEWKSWKKVHTSRRSERAGGKCMLADGAWPWHLESFLSVPGGLWWAMLRELQCWMLIVS